MTAAAHPFDAAQEQQGLDVEVAQGCGNLLDRDRRGNFRPVEGKHKKRFGCGLIKRLHKIRPDVLLDPEMLVRAVDPGCIGVRVDRLEADAEPADLGKVFGLGALANSADAAHVGGGKRAAVVAYLQPIVEKLKGQLCRAGVFGVLDQLEDEVRAVAVELPEQFEDGRVPAVARDVLRANLVIISGHLYLHDSA